MSSHSYIGHDQSDLQYKARGGQVSYWQSFRAWGPWPHFEKVGWFGHVESSCGAVRTACDRQVDGRLWSGRPKMILNNMTENDYHEKKLTTVNPLEKNTCRSGVRSAMLSGSHSPSISSMSRPLDKNSYWQVIFLISQPKHMLWVLKRTASRDSSFEHPKHMYELMGMELNAILGAQTILIWTYACHLGPPGLVRNKNPVRKERNLEKISMRPFHSVGPEVYGICACTFFWDCTSTDKLFVQWSEG